jgi:hypothetical protein
MSARLPTGKSPSCCPFGATTTETSTGGATTAVEEVGGDGGGSGVRTAADVDVDTEDPGVLHAAKLDAAMRSASVTPFERRNVIKPTILNAGA